MKRPYDDFDENVFMLEFTRSQRKNVLKFGAILILLFMSASIIAATTFSISDVVRDVAGVKNGLSEQRD